jgi:putative transcriptional regulator
LPLRLGQSFCGLQLLGSVREGGAILRGQKKPSRRIVIGASGVRAIRERTSLSQSEFADLIGVSIKTLQNWEQDRQPSHRTRSQLLSIIAHEQTFHTCVWPRASR